MTGLENLTVFGNFAVAGALFALAYEPLEMSRVLITSFLRGLCGEREQSCSLPARFLRVAAAPLLVFADVLFFAAAAVLFFGYVLLWGTGAVRWFYFLGAAFGAAVYLVTAHKIIAAVYLPVGRFILLPLGKLLYFIYAEIVVFSGLCGKFLKNRAKKILKFFTNLSKLVYNRRAHLKPKLKLFKFFQSRTNRRLVNNGVTKHTQREVRENDKIKAVKSQPEETPAVRPKIPAKIRSVQTGGGI